MVSVIRGNRGQSVIEFALILPLMLLILFGITEFGRCWMTQNILTSAAREGCRLAIVTAPDVNAVTARVFEVCAAAGVNPSAVVVQGPGGDPERRVTVTVQTDFTVIPGGILTYFGGGFTGVVPLRATSIMRHEAL